jgi:membrane-associated phospholipid phosphatase
MTSSGVTTTRTTTSRRSALVALAAICVVLLGALYVVAVRTEVGQRVDEAAIEGRTTDTVVQHAVAGTLDTVSVTSIFLATVALIVIALVRRRPLLAIGIGVLVLGANVTTQVMKDTLTRPDLLSPATMRGALATFPSGHSTVAMSLALALVLAVPARLRVLVGIAGITYAVLVGAATLTGAWHRPSDVLGAYLVTLGWAAVVCAWLVAPRGPQPREPDGNAVVLDGIVVVLALLVIAAAVVIGVDVARDSRLDQLDVGRAYVGGVFAIAAGAVLALSALVITLDRAPLDPPGLARSRARVDRSVSTPPE